MTFTTSQARLNAQRAARERLRRRKRGKVPDLVGVAEAAELLGLSRSALMNRRNSLGFTRQTARAADAKPLPFPWPVLELRCGPLWLRDDVVDYGIARGLRTDA